MDRREFGGRMMAAAGLATASLASGDQVAKADDSTDAKSLIPVKVTDYQRLAQRKLETATFDYINTGSADEVTLRENIAAFQRVRLLPPLLTGVAQADLSTSILKQPIKLPVLLSPVAAQRLYHPQGALAAARAAAAMGTIYGCSSSVGHNVEEVGSASPGPKWFQLYVPKDRAIAKQLVQRAERAGFQAIVLTVDLGEWKDADRRNRFSVPKEMLVRQLRDMGFSQVHESMSFDEVIAFNASAWDLTYSWDIFDWLRGITKLPLLIKGVLRVDDAKKAVAIGLDGIVVSNHGGRRLDQMPASIDVLPEIVAAVGNKTTVLMDGGIRRGTDILIALARGAKAVLIGRPYAWALAAEGEAGVKRCLELLRDELQNAMISCGCARLSDINASLIRSTPGAS